MLLAHIRGKDTFGIKVNKVSKFLAFDVDVYSPDIAHIGLQAVRQILNTLESVGVPREAVGVFYSGSKGYHVDIFFNGTVKVEELAKFHKAILAVRLEEYGELEGVNIEARGSNGQGYKLPLGIHKKTGKRMWSLDIDTLKEQPYKVPIIEPMDVMEFYIIKDELLDSYAVQDAHRGAVANLVKVRKQYTDEEVRQIQERIEENKNTLSKVLEARSLLEKGTRNDVIFLLALYSNSTSRSEAEAKALIYEVMDNTPAELFNDNSSTSWKHREADKVVTRVYKANWKLRGFEANAKFTSEELEHIITSCKTLKEMSLYLCFMIYGKQFMSGDGTFYLAQTTMANETGLVRNHLTPVVNKLVKNGLVEVVQKGYYVHVDGAKIGIATTYKVPYLIENKDKPAGEIDVKKATTETLVEAVAGNISKDNLKRLLSRRMLANFI